VNMEKDSAAAESFFYSSIVDAKGFQFICDGGFGRVHAAIVSGNLWRGSGCS